MEHYAFNREQAWHDTSLAYNKIKIAEMNDN
jgi:hypothetical protein